MPKFLYPLRMTTSKKVHSIQPLGRLFGLITALISTLSTGSTQCFAYQDPITIGQAAESRIRIAVENTHPLTHARVALADYELLTRDFPELRGLEHSEIDHWLLRRTAWMGVEQILEGSSRNIHSPIPHDSSAMIPMMRPFGYGRALVTRAYSRIPFDNDRLFDIKGVGTPDPQLKPHQTGVADLREMLSEFAMEKLVHQVFLDSGEPYDTVETYAVLDLGFRIYKLNGEILPAGAVVRQGHLRVWDGVSASIANLHDKRGKSAVRAESLLQRYGLTGNAVDYFVHYDEALKSGSTGYSCEGCNIQGFFGHPMRNAVTLVDFGTYTALKEITIGDVAPYADDASCPDEKRESYHFPQKIDPTKQVSVDTWGMDWIDPDNKDRGLKDNLHLWAHRWSNRFASLPFGGDLEDFQALRDELHVELNQMLTREKEHWAKGANEAKAMYY